MTISISVLYQLSEVRRPCGSNADGCAHAGGADGSATVVVADRGQRLLVRPERRVSRCGSGRPGVSPAWETGTRYGPDAVGRPADSAHAGISHAFGRARNNPVGLGRVFEVYADAFGKKSMNNQLGSDVHG